MRQHFAMLVGFLGMLGMLSIPCAAEQLAVCAPDFSSCEIPENVLLDLPFVAIAGDVIVLEPDLSAISDVFRIFNNLLDTGAGTGLGNQAFLFSSDDNVPLPDSSTFSANAVAILETPNGLVTSFNGNGTNYLLGAPEPSTLVLLGIGLVPLVGFARMRLRCSGRSHEKRSPETNA